MLESKYLMPALAFSGLILLSFTPLSAGPKQTLLKIPVGAQVQFEGTSKARISGGGFQNESGTFDCRCSGVKHNGTCVLGRGSSAIICGDSGSTCEGTCKLYTTTTGVMGGKVMQ